MSYDPAVTTLFGPRESDARGAPLGNRPRRSLPFEINRRSLGRTLVFFAILLFLLSAYLEAAHYWRMTQWTQANAIVLGGEFHEKQSHCGPSFKVPCEEYSFRTTVSYLVAGEARESQIDSPPFYHKIEAVMWASHFPRGRQLAVVYKPADPSAVRLVDEPSPFLNALGVLKAGLCLFVPGVLLILAWRSERSDRPEDL